MTLQSNNQTIKQHIKITIKQSNNQTTLRNHNQTIKQSTTHQNHNQTIKQSTTYQNHNQTIKQSNDQQHIKITIKIEMLNLNRLIVNFYKIKRSINEMRQGISHCLLDIAHQYGSVFPIGDVVRDHGLIQPMILTDKLDNFRDIQRIFEKMVLLEVFDAFGGFDVELLGADRPVLKSGSNEKILTMLLID